MADILLYFVAYAGEKVHKKITESRSPLIPPPPPSTASLPPSIEEPSMEDLAPIYTREPLPMHPAQEDATASPAASSPPRTTIPTNFLSRIASSSASNAVTSTVRPTPRSRSQTDTASTMVKVPPLTEHTLRETHLAWKIRYQSLYLRLATLLDALKRGLRTSWAGRVTWERCDEVRLAILEAEFVMRKLGQAVEWCDQKGLQRLPLTALVAGKRRSSVSRPTHTERPPSLADLPSPLPEAPPAISTRLTVPIPPAAFRPGYSYTNPDEPVATTEDPPPYTRHYDSFRGERVLQRARWEEDRLSDGADAVLLIR